MNPSPHPLLGAQAVLGRVVRVCGEEWAEGVGMQENSEAQLCLQSGEDRVGRLGSLLLSFLMGT